MVAWVVMNRQQPRQTPPSFSPLPFPFWVSPLPHRRKNYPFVFMHLRGTHFATLLFSNSCMEWGGCTPRRLECLSPAPYVLNDHRYGRASLLPTSLPGPS